MTCKQISQIAAYSYNKDVGDWDTDQTEEQYLERLTQSSMDVLIEETLSVWSYASRIPPSDEKHLLLVD